MNALDETGKTALHCACLSGNTEVSVRVLGFFGAHRLILNGSFVFWVPFN